jgi:hypothetical protein
MSQKKRVRIYKAGGQQGAYVNPTAKWMMQMGGASPQEQGDEQIMIAVQQGILNGADPNDIYDSLVAQGMPKQQVEQIIRVVMDSIETMDEEAYVQESGDQEAAIELAQQEADLMNQQSQSQMNQFMDGAPDINEMIMEDDDYDDYDDEDDDDLFDMAKGGIPRKADFMKQIKQLGGKIKQGERPEDASGRFVSTFINSVRNANDAALLEKQAEEYYDNELLPQAQRGREARRARRQQRQMNRGINKIMRNTPVGYMGQGMLPQNIGVINPFAMPVGNMGQGMPMGYPGLQMANIEVHKTGLFGRPKQYSMTFNWNTQNTVKEAEDVAKSITQSITDEESKKQQEGKPNNKEEAQEVEQVVEQTTEQQKPSGGGGTKKNEKPVVVTTEPEESQKKDNWGQWYEDGIPKDVAEAIRNKEFKQVNENKNQPLIDPAIALLEDEIESLEQMSKVARDRGKTDSNLYKDNKKLLQKKKYELKELRNPQVYGKQWAGDEMRPYTGYPGAGIGYNLVDAYDYITGSKTDQGWRDIIDQTVAGGFTRGFVHQPASYLPGQAIPRSYGQAVYTPPAGQAALGPGRAALPQFPGQAVPQLAPGSSPLLLPPGSSAVAQPINVGNAIIGFRQGGMINSFEVNPLAEFIYGGNIPKAQEGDAGRPSWFNDWLKENQNNTNAARQEAINRMNQGIIGYGDGRYNLPNTMYGNPYPYGRGYGNIPTMFNPYGRPVISNRQTWMQQRGLATDAQGNPVMNPQALPLTKFEVTRSGLFGRPRRWSAEFGNYNQGDNTQRPEKVVTQQDLDNAQASAQTSNSVDDTYQPSSFGEKLMLSNNRLLSRIGSKMTPIGDHTSSRSETDEIELTDDVLENNQLELVDVSGLVDPAELQEVAPEIPFDLPLRNYGRDQLYTTADLKRGVDLSSPFTGPVAAPFTEPSEEDSVNWNNRAAFMEGLVNSELSKRKYGGRIPRYQTAGTTPLYLSNPFEEDDNAILNMSQRNDYGQVIIPDYSQPPAMQTQERFDDYFSPESSIERAADLVGTGEGTAEIVPQDPSGYKTKGKFKDQFDVDFGAAWDLANYGVRTATNYLRDAEQQRQYNLGMLSMDPNAMYTQRDRGDYHTNPGLGSNFRNPSTGFKGVAQQGGQFNIGDELEMTDKEIAEFIAAGGKLKFV